MDEDFNEQLADFNKNMEDRDKLLLAESQRIVDAVNYSSHTKFLYKLLVGILQQEHAVVSINMINGDHPKPVHDASGAIISRRPETIEERNDRFSRTMGFLEGLGEMEIIVESARRRVTLVKDEDNAKHNEGSDDNS